MRFSYLYILAALIVGAAGCTKSDGGVSEGRLYPVTIEAGEGDVETTRSIWHTGDPYYYWTAGDEVGLSVTNTGNTTTIAHNVRMTGNHSSTVLNTSFTGNFTQAQIEAMSPTGKYDYYSYFPYQSGGGDAAYPNVRFSIPSEITLKPGEITATYAPMVGTPHIDEWAITYLDGNNQVHSENIRFKYRHVMSFLALAMECNLMSQPITSVTITASNPGTRLSGMLDVNVANGTAAWASGTNSLTVNIDGGFNVGDILYIPMLPADLSSQTLDLSFKTADGSKGYTNGVPTNSNRADVSIPGGNLVRGQTHSLQVKVPFRVSFDEFYTLANAGLRGMSPDREPFNYKGYTFGRSDRTDLMSNYVRLDANNTNAVVITPAIDLRTMSGRNNILVRLSILTMVSNQGTKSMRYGAVSTVSDGIEDSEYVSARFPSISYPNWTIHTFESGDMTLNVATPCVALNYVANQADCSVQEIILTPVY